MRIEGWSVVGSWDPYMAPELQCVRLMGHVYGHPMHHDGKDVVTSRIVGEINDEIVTASGSRYVLGSVSAEYEALFPGAQERLLREIRKRTNGTSGLS